MVDKFDVNGIHCASCAKRITTAIQKIEPGARVKVDVATGAVEVEGAIDRPAVAGAIEGAGFALRPAP